MKLTMVSMRQVIGTTGVRRYVAPNEEKMP